MNLIHSFYSAALLTLYTTPVLFKLVKPVLKAYVCNFLQLERFEDRQSSAENGISIQIIPVALLVRTMSSKGPSFSRGPFTIRRDISPLHSRL